jgi:flagellum-specific peptidoglycan hydrolase FlgJ
VYAKTPETKTTATADPVYLDYIKNHYRLAIQQQKKYKIPASITLAQALLESGAGQSYLALAGNNHFGIKCQNWKGLHVYKNDVGVYECFRKYLYVYSSFEDHSRFLTERPYYRPLFKLNQTDYKSWAEGLRKCGYAADPQYTAKLIRLIEIYQLYYYDTAKESDPPILPQKKVASNVKNAGSKVSPKTSAKSVPAAKPVTRSSSARSTTSKPSASSKK